MPAVIVVLLALLSIPPASQVGSTGSAAGRDFALHSALANCADIIGTNVWTGTFGYGTTMSGGGQWTSTFTVDANGTLDGFVSDGQSFTNTLVTGSVTCSTWTFATPNGASPQLSGTANVDTTTGVATGTWSAFSGAFSGEWEASDSTTPTLSITPSPLATTPGPVTYTATLTGTGPTPDGVVSITDGVGTPCPGQSLNASNQAMCTFTEVAPGPYTITANYTGDTFYTNMSTTMTVNAAVSNGSSATTGPNTSVTATATGGTAGVDAVTESQYTIPPVPALADGTNYFDVAVSSSNFSQVVVTDCNNVTAATVLYWWDTSANGGFGGWDVINSDNPPLGPPIYSSPCLTATFDANSTPTAAELVGTVLATAPITGPAFETANGAHATVGSPFRQTVSTVGSPLPSIRKTGRLPHGLHFVNNHNGTATISGTPTSTRRRSALGTYNLTIKATFGRGRNKHIVTQDFTLTVTT